MIEVTLMLLQRLRRGSGCRLRVACCWLGSATSGWMKPGVGSPRAMLMAKGQAEHGFDGDADEELPW